MERWEARRESRGRGRFVAWVVVAACGGCWCAAAPAAPLAAGVARVEITDRDAGPVHDPAFVTALVFDDGSTRAAIVAVDAVAIGGIGRIGDGYLPRVRGELAAELGIPPGNVVVNASHCHAAVRGDADALTVRAVRDAWAARVPVAVGCGTAREDRISENRRVRLVGGGEADMRRAYPLPADAELAGVGPIDPQVGILRIDRLDGRPLAVLYHFACHPIMNPPARGSSADFPGVASRVVEEALGEGCLAVFVQGCGGDVNPIRYKEMQVPPDAEPLGTMLGATVLAGRRAIAVTPDATVAAARTALELPRADDYERRIEAIEAERAALVAGLRSTNVNFKSFLPLYLGGRIDPDFPTHHAQATLRDRAEGREELPRLAAESQRQVDDYLHNIRTMERLTRLNTNLALLRMHEEQTRRAGDTPLVVEVCGLRVGDFRLVAFPGELSVEIGMAIRERYGAPHAYVSGYTNGYIYYTPTDVQRRNPDYAQEDCDTLVAPGWQPRFEDRALEILRGL